MNTNHSNTGSTPGARLLAALATTGVIAAAAVGQPTVSNESDFLVQFDSAIGDAFGRGVDLDGDLAIVGANADDDLGASSGSAYIYRLDAGAWVLEQKLTASDGQAGEQYGWSVAIQGDTAIVGARLGIDGGVGSGTAYVYEYDVMMGAWVETAKIVSSDAAGADNFGISVDLDGDAVVIGSRQDDDNGTRSGSAYVFRRNSMGIWDEEAKLLASDGGGNDNFGSGVGIDGDFVVANGGGAAYVFHRDAMGTWQEEAILLGPDTLAVDGFGTSPSIDGEVVAVGAYLRAGGGAAYVFRRDAMGTWQHEATVTGSDTVTGDQFGGGLSLCGDTLVVGAPRHDGVATDSGAAYFFRRDTASGAWVEQEKFIPSDSRQADLFGAPIAACRNAVIGALLDDVGGRNSGSAYIFPVLRPCTAEPSGLIHWWPGNGDASDIRGDSSGTFVNGATTAFGLVGQAFSFDGVNDYVDTGADAPFDFERTDSFSADAWIFVDDTTKRQDILGKQLQSPTFQGWNFRISQTAGDQVLFVHLRNANSNRIAVRGTTPLLPATWYHVAFTYDGSSAAAGLNIYVNGVAETLSVTADTLTASILNNVTLDIGAGGQTAINLFFGGLIDEVGIYDRELTVQDIQAIVNANNGGKCETPPITDTDGDGLDDIDEIALGTDPNVADTDGDTLSDGDEVNIYGTNPLAVDTDGDLLFDNEEVSLQQFGCPDPLVADSDADGLPDGLEILLGLDACDADTDGDGLADGLESTYGTDPLVVDTDGDGLDDGTEVDVAQGGACPSPTNADSDGDTISDGDESILGTSPCDADTDGDGIPDNLDPLPTDPEGTQDFIETELRDLAETVGSIPLTEFSGNNNASKGRRNATCSKLNAAAKQIANGNYQEAIDKLNSSLAKLDDEPSPPDWMEPGMAKDAVRQSIEDMVVLLNYLL